MQTSGPAPESWEGVDGTSAHKSRYRFVTPTQEMLLMSLMSRKIEGKQAFCSFLKPRAPSRQNECP